MVYAGSVGGIGHHEEAWQKRLPKGLNLEVLYTRDCFTMSARYSECTAATPRRSARTTASRARQSRPRGR